MKCLMVIAVFCDDQAMYDRVLDYFYYGEGNGEGTNGEKRRGPHTANWFPYNFFF